MAAGTMPRLRCSEKSGESRMTDRPWLAVYPQGGPADIDATQYPSLVALMDEAFRKHADRVAIMMPNVPQCPVAVAAVLRAGLVVVNVNPLYTPRELEHQLKDSGAKAIVLIENFAN